jgi:glycerophosphoryl diester phosphodiesterase
MYQFKINEVIGHRGCNSLAYSNTIEAFLKAIELGADMVEFDVRKTKDSILIVHHDPDVFGYEISGNTFSELKMVAKRNGLHLSTFEEVLHSLRGKTHLDIELKEPGYEKDVAQLAQKFFSTSEFVMKSFHDESVLAIKKNFPDISAGLLVGTNDELTFDAHVKNKNLKIFQRKYHELFPWKRLNTCGADFVSPHKQLLMFGFLKEAQQRNIPVFAWTINDKKTFSSLWKTHLVSGFITDVPDLARDLRS